VAAVAIRRGLGVFTAAKILGAFLGDGKCHWLKFSAFMGTVTERLVPGTATGTPPVLTGFQIFHARLLLRYHGVCHNVLLLSARNGKP
jgi:hypothetical protein